MLWSTTSSHRSGPVPASHPQTASGRMASAFTKALAAFAAPLLTALTPLLFTGLSFGQTVILGTPTPIGTQSSPVNVSVRLPRGGTISSVHLRTGGVENLDFSLAGVADCSTQATYLPNKVCNFSVIFQPKYPGQRVGAVILLDSNNSVVGSSNIVGTGLGPLSLFVPGTIQTVAGDASWIYHPGDDGIPATTSPIYLPYGITVDGAGNLFIADGNNNRIRRVDAASQIVTTVVGNGSPGASGDGGPATQASIALPSAVAVDATGNLYFADSGNHVVRRVDAFTNVITTIAGQIGTYGYSGDDGPGTLALLNSPSGVALDVSGHLYIADTLNNVIRRLDLSTGVLSAFAGNHKALYSGDGGPALSASLNGPWSVTAAASGIVYIADQSNHCVRKVDTSGTITTIAGNGRPGFDGDNANAAGAVLNSPSSVAVDVAGNIYISDSGNNRVRKINANSGVIQTVIGSGDETFQGDGNAANTAGLYGPYGLALDGAGDLFIADVFHNRIRMVSSNSTTLYYASIRANKVSLPQTTMLENDGNAPLNFAAVQAVTNAKVDSATTTCSPDRAVNSSLTCVIGADFAPTSVGDPVIGSISIASDSPNSAQTITLQGPATKLDASIVGLTSSANPSAFGAPVVLTATLATTGTSLPTGTVTFLDGTSTLGTGTIDSTGIARLTISTLSLGAHTLSVSYSGDTNNESSISPNFTQIVKVASVVKLSASPGTSTYHQNVTFTANVSTQNAVPTGTITFFDGGTPLGTVTLDSGGFASLSTSALNVSTHQITASYSGDTVAIANTSNVISEVVGKASSSVALSTSSPSVAFSDTVTLTAVVNSQSGLIPTGSVVFLDGSAVLQTVTLDGSGTAALSTPALAVGAHAITATYSGDPNDFASSSSPVTQSVTAISTTTLLASSLSPVPAGGSVRLTATVTGALNPATTPLTGSVSFLDGSVTLGTATLTSGIAFVDINSPSIGQHSIIATYNGAVDYATSASAALSLNVQLATTISTLGASPAPGIAGKAVVLTAGVTGNGGNPSGIVIFKDGGTSIGQGTVNASGVTTFTISTLGPGPHMLTANYGGDQNDQPSSASLNFNVRQASTTTALSSSGSPAVFGLPLTLAASVSGTGGTPGGTVTFYEGARLLGATQLDSTGKAVLTLASLPVGTHDLSAVYAGDTNDTTSNSAPIQQLISKTTTNTSLTTSAATLAQGSPVLFTAQVSSNSGIPGGSVQFFDGSTLLGTGTLSQAGVTTLSTSSLVPGQHNITAVFPGDDSNSPSTSSSLAQLVNPVTIVGLTATPNPASTGGTVTLTAGVSGARTIPTGLITFFDGNAILGTGVLNGAGVATLSTSSLALGAHPLKASYAGDQNNTGSTSGVTMLQVNLATTQAVLSLASNTAGLGAPVTMTIAVTGSGGIPGGSISLLDGSTVIGTVALTAAGTANFSTSTLAIGPHTLTASYAGDSNDGPSTSAPGVLTIAKQSTQLIIDTSSNPALGGTAVSFTAALRVATGTPTGSIVWSDGNTVLATTPVSGTGSSNLTTLQLAPGQPHTITASYSGDGTFQPANSNAIAETVNQGTSSVTVAAASSSASAGTAVTLSISVVGTGAQPGGSVILLDNDARVGIATLDSNGNASFVTSTLGVGDHALTAAYPGDVNHTSSQSSSIPQHINANSTVVALSSSRNPAIAGDLIAFSITVSGSGPQPGGAVQMTDGGLPFGPKLTLDGNGVASYTPLMSLAAGTHNLVASYLPDAAHSGSTASLAETITQAASATTLAASKNPALAGDTITLSVAVTGSGSQPAGTVQITDGGIPLGQKLVLDGSGLASLNLGTPLSPGAHSLAATYSGDTNHGGSNSATVIEIIQQSTQTALNSNRNPGSSRSTVVFTATVAPAGSLPVTGKVTFLDGTTILGTAPVNAAGLATFSATSLSPGQHSISAGYSGDNVNQASSSAALNQLIDSEVTVTTLSGSGSPSFVTAAVTLTARVSGGSVVPTGTVNFLDGSTVLGTGTVSAGGIATLSTTALHAGSHVLLAIYQGDSDHANSTSNPVQEVIQQQTAITLASAINPSAVASNIPFTVMVSAGAGNSVPTGSVTLTDGTATIGTAILDAKGNTAFSSATLAVGQHSLVATYAGDAENTASSSGVLVQSIRLHASTTLLASSTASTLTGQPIVLTASLSGDGPIPPSGSVVFTSGSTVLGTAVLNASGLNSQSSNPAGNTSTATLSLSGIKGSYSVVATYAGDSLYSGSASGSTSLVVNDPPDFTITLSPNTMSLSSKQHSTLKITLTSLQGFSDTLALGCVGLPASATCTFSTDHSKLDANGNQVVQLTVDTGSPLVAGGAATARNSDSVAKPFGSTRARLCALPGSLAVIFLLVRSRRSRRMLPTLLALLVAAVSFAVSGCGTLDVNGTPAGQYTFNVTAIGANTAVTQSAPLQLKVTQ